jgi:hypothetical protein
MTTYYLEHHPNHRPAPRPLMGDNLAQVGALQLKIKRISTKHFFVNSALKNSFFFCDGAPGASPRHCGTPVAMKPYYLDITVLNFPVQVMQKYRNAPPPPTGAGLAHGG